MWFFNKRTKQDRIDDRNRLIFQCYQDGYNIDDLSEYFKLHKGSIKRILVSLEATMQPVEEHSEQKDLLSMYNDEGLTHGEIAEELQVDAKTIWDRLHSLEVAGKLVETQKQRSAKIRKLRMQSILERYEEIGNKPTEIAYELNIDVQLVQKAILQAMNDGIISSEKKDKNKAIRSSGYKEIADMYNKGYTHTEMAKKFNYDVNNIGLILRNLNKEGKLVRSVTWTEDEERQIAFYIKKKLSYIQIAKYMECPVSIMKKYIHG